MSDVPHDHTRPDRAAMQSALDVARALLVGNPAAAHRAISDAACGPCATIAAVQFSFTLCSVFAGRPWVDQELAARLLNAVNAAQAGLRESPN